MTSSPPPPVHHVAVRDGTRIAWRARGGPGQNERPSIILTNGLGTTSNFWSPLTSRLARDHRVVDWDNRGHGDSEVPTSHDYAITTQAADLARVVEASEEARWGEASRGPPVHVAFSMGVTVLLELYRARPGLVRAMVLIAGVADHPYATSPLFQVPGARLAVRAGLRGSAPVMRGLAPLTRRLSRSPAIFSLGRAMGALGADAPRAELEHFFRAVGSMDMRAYWGTLRALFEAHTSDVLSTVDVPVLIVAPGNDVMAPARDLDLLRRRIPGAEWTRIPGTGHALLLEAPRIVAERVSTFLRALPGPT